MHKDQLYPILDSIKLAIETSCLVLNASRGVGVDTRFDVSIASAQSTIDLAQRKMREALSFDFDLMEYKDSDDE